MWLLVLAVLLTACGAGDTGGDGARTERAKLAGQHVRLDSAISPSNGGLVLWFHGQGGDRDNRMHTPWLDALRERGWAVASSDLHGNSWGDTDSVNDARQIYQWAAAKTGATHVLLVAGSMGGLSSLNALRGGAVNATCWYGTMPALNLPVLDRQPQFRSEIDSAYRGSDLAANSPALAPGGTFPRIRYRVLASPQDQLVDKSTNADLLVQHLRSAGLSVTTKATRGLHGDPSHFDERDLTAFAAGC